VHCFMDMAAVRATKTRATVVIATSADNMQGSHGQRMVSTMFVQGARDGGGVLTGPLAGRPAVWGEGKQAAGHGIRKTRKNPTEEMPRVRQWQQRDVPF